MNTLSYRLIHFFFQCLGVLPLDAASTAGGKLFELVGPLTGRHRIALKNLALIYPQQSESWRKATAKQMWNHLGRLVAEFSALSRGELLGRIEDIRGVENLTVHDQTIFVSAHLGQWELLTPLAKSHGVGAMTSIYRHINHPKIDQLILNYRSKAHDKLIRKKGDNAIALVRALKKGDSLALLIDQRLTSGDLMPFMGVPTPTNTAAIKLAIKMNLPIVPSFIYRTQGAHFIADIAAPILPPEQGSEAEKIASMSRQVFDVIEAQIHAHPDQYLWVHNRWK